MDMGFVNCPDCGSGMQVDGGVNEKVEVTCPECFLELVVEDAGGNAMVSQKKNDSQYSSEDYGQYD